MRQERGKQETVICRDSGGSGVCVYLSEEAAGRVAWALTDVIAVLSLPIIIMAVVI